MKKTELVTRTQMIANQKMDDGKFTKKEITAVIDSLYDAVVEAVKAGDSVKVNEVTYKVKEVPERSGMIQLGDRKGETWTKPAHKEVMVKVSSTLKNVLA